MVFCCDGLSKLKQTYTPSLVRLPLRTVHRAAIHSGRRLRCFQQRHSSSATRGMTWGMTSVSASPQPLLLPSYQPQVPCCSLNGLSWFSRGGANRRKESVSSAETPSEASPTRVTSLTCERELRTASWGGAGTMQLRGCPRGAPPPPVAGLSS